MLLIIVEAQNYDILLYYHCNELELVSCIKIQSFYETFEIENLLHLWTSSSTPW